MLKSDFCVQSFHYVWEKVKVRVRQKKCCSVLIHIAGKAAQVDVRHAFGQCQLGLSELL